MRKGIIILLSVLLGITLAAIPFLCSHCSILPEKATQYYEEKARREAQADDSPEAQLMRMLLGGAAEETKEPEPSHPAFSTYGLSLAFAAALGCAAPFVVRTQKKGNRVAVFPLFAAVALAAPLGLFGARFVYCAAKAGFYLKDIENPAAMLRVWEGGLSLSGALAFTSLGGVLAAKLCKASVRHVLDAMTPGLITLAGVARLGERLIGAGYGPEADVLTVLIQGSFRLDTALVMMFAMLILLALRLDFARSAFLYGGLMILLESLRRDGHMQWGFVHAEQIFALCMALPALLYFAAKNKKVWLALLATAALVGIVVGLEFALDRSPISDWLLYGIFAAVIAAYLWLGLYWAGKAHQQKE